MSLKKILAVAMCATVVSATGAMMASADEETINLMPANEEAVTANNVDVTYEGGKLVIKGSDVEGTVSWTPNASYDLVEKAFVYISLTTDKGFDGTMAVTADGTTRTPGMSADFGGSFGMTSGFGTELVPAGEYVGLALNTLGVFTWDGTIAKEAESVSGSIGKIELKVQPGATMTVSNLYAGPAGLDGSEIPNDPANPATTGNAGDATQAPGNDTTTTKKNNPSTGESTAMVASGIVLAVVSASAVALTMKKKAQ